MLSTPRREPQLEALEPKIVLSGISMRMLVLDHAMVYMSLATAEKIVALANPNVHVRNHAHAAIPARVVASRREFGSEMIRLENRILRAGDRPLVRLMQEALPGADGSLGGANQQVSVLPGALDRLGINGMKQ
jgi:hypothetical protein